MESRIRGSAKKPSKSSGGKTLKVTTPNGGQKWTSGKKYTLKWSKGNAERFVKIELLKSGKAYKTIHKRTKNDGRHRWSIPSTIATGSAYKIKITSTSKANVKDQSDKNFKITKAGRSKSDTVNVSGSWAGTFVSYNGQKGAVTGKFVQKGNTFSGPLRLYGSPCFSYEFATGAISGSEIVFGIINDAIIIEASVKESTISGVYYVYKSPWGYCTGDSGTLVLRRY